MNTAALEAFYAQMTALGAPGCEVMIARNHEILYHGCTGETKKNQMYFMYSATKPVLITAAMQCVEQGLFALEDEVGKYLPAFAQGVVDQGGRYVPRQKPLLIRHLMTMTSGMDYNLFNNYVTRLLALTEAKATTRQIVDALACQPLLFEPGTRYNYALSLDVVGAIIEVVTGQSLRDYCQEHIFRPLGMTRTDFWIPGMVVEDLAPQYYYNRYVPRLEKAEAANWLVPSQGFHSGGAGLVSCAEDYIRFTDALACGESREGVWLLSAQSIALMRKDHMADLGVAESFSSPSGDQYSYGLGVRTRKGGGDFGWDGAAGVDLLIEPERGLSVVLTQHVLEWMHMEGNVHVPLREAVDAFLLDNE